MTSVYSRAWRTLRHLRSFRTVAELSPRDDSLIRTLDLDAEEEVIGVYGDKELPGQDLVLVTSEGLHILRELGPQSFLFKDIESVHIPEGSEKREAREVRVCIQGGGEFLVPVCGGSERTSDAYEFLRFLMRVLEDAKGDGLLLPLGSSDRIGQE